MELPRKARLLGIQPYPRAMHTRTSLPQQNSCSIGRRCRAPLVRVFTGVLSTQSVVCTHACYCCCLLYYCTSTRVPVGDVKSQYLVVTVLFCRKGFNYAASLRSTYSSTHSSPSSFYSKDDSSTSGRYSNVRTKYGRVRE